MWAMTILIDPGHGGEEDGATREFNGVMVKEKDLTLSISKLIYEKLQKKHRVFLTRSFDRTVTLQERAQIAEKIKADLFISVHINSSTDPRAKGIETFYLDNHDDIAVKKVEKTENINPGTADGIQQILIDLAVEQTVQTSKPLAFLVHAEAKKNLKGRYAMLNRGVKPALFYVLALSKRPGVLLEAGFMTNDDDLKKIQQEKFQQLYADAVVRVLATGNDFRAIEACGHAYAARDGEYRGLSDCEIKDDTFTFSLEIPLALGTVGGLTALHPMAKLSLDMLQNPNAKELMEIVAVIGLAQNFGAVRSLVTSGIQKGHMKMHLMNILNHLEANNEERELAKVKFENEIISFNAVREYIKSLRELDN